MPTTRQIRSSVAYRALCRTVRREEHTCWLCRQPIDVTLPYRDPGTGRVNPRSWSLDHVLPLDDWPHLGLDRTNARAAHLSCNSGRGKRTPGRRPATQPLVTTRAW